MVILIADDKTADLRREVDIDDHDVELETLVRRYTTDVHRGFAPEQVEENRGKFGGNKLTPPPGTSEWVSWSHSC